MRISLLVEVGVVTGPGIEDMLKGQLHPEDTRSSSPELEYMLERCTYPIPPSSALGTRPSIQELLLRVFIGSEREPLAPATIGVPISTVPIDPSIS